MTTASILAAVAWHSRAAILAALLTLGGALDLVAHEHLEICDAGGVLVSGRAVMAYPKLLARNAHNFP